MVSLETPHPHTLNPVPDKLSDIKLVRGTKKVADRCSEGLNLHGLCWTCSSWFKLADLDDGPRECKVQKLSEEPPPGPPGNSPVMQTCTSDLSPAGKPGCRTSTGPGRLKRPSAVGQQEAAEVSSDVTT